MIPLEAHAPTKTLEDALASLQAEVKADPANSGLRFKFAETLLLTGAYERADTHLDLVSTQDPSLGLRVALIRQLIRAQLWRSEVFTQGRAPEVIGDVTPEVSIALKILMNQHDGSEAARLRTEADAAAVEIKGLMDDRPFSGLRDLDDRTADILEVLTSTGKYFWIPLRQIRSLDLQEPNHVRELVWRPATLDVADGPEGLVYIPSIYPPAGRPLDDDHRLGRKTPPPPPPPPPDWFDVNGLTVGVGAAQLARRGRGAFDDGVYEPLRLRRSLWREVEEAGALTGRRQSSLTACSKIPKRTRGARQALAGCEMVCAGTLRVFSTHAGDFYPGPRR